MTNGNFLTGERGRGFNEDSKISKILDVGQKELNLTGREFLEVRILSNDGGFELIDGLILAAQDSKRCILANTPAVKRGHWCNK